MDSKRTFYIAILQIGLSFLSHDTVGSETDSCLPYFIEEQPYCVMLTSLKEAEKASDVVFSIYRDRPRTLHEAQFNFNRDVFFKFHKCLSNTNGKPCQVQFKRTTSYNYTADQVNDKQILDDPPRSTDYWTCLVPLYPENNDLPIIACKPRDIKPETPPCNLTGMCSSVGIVEGQNEHKKPAKVIWTSPLSGDPTHDCENGRLEITFENSDVTVIRCSADIGSCNDSNTSVTEDCNETPAGVDQSEEGAPTAVIIGVVCGILVIIILAVLGAFFIRQKVRNKQRPTTTKISGRSPNLAAVPSALDTDKNDSGAFPSKDAGSNMPSNIPKNNRGLVLAYDSIAATSTTRDSVTLNGYATIADTECDSGSPLDSNDNRVKNHNHAPAETSQYSFIDRADAAGNGYSKLGEPVRNFKNPYNVLLKPKEDPRARNPVPIPDESTKQPSRYSLAHPILDGGSSRPIEVVDIVHPAHNPDKTSEKDNAKESESKSTNDYDYPSDEEMPVKQKDPMYSEVEKEEEFAETTTTGGDTDRPYFELEKVEESDTDYGAAYPTSFDPQE